MSQSSLNPRMHEDYAFVCVVEFLCLSVCLSKYLYMPVCLHVSLALSKHLWCRPSRPGIPSSIPDNSSLKLGL